MAACDFLRMIGILTHFVCVILFLVAMGTVHWTNVKHFSGEAGLWQYCKLHKNISSSDKPSGVTLTPGSSTTPSFIWTSTSPAPVPSSEEDDDDDETDEEECSSFGVVHIDAYLHFVRLLIILALFSFAYGFCKGTTIRVKIEYDPRFVRQHLGELLSLSGAMMAMLALQVYGQSFKSDGTILPYLKGRQGPNGEQDGDLLELGWSVGLLEGSMFTLIPAVVLMMMPTLSEKCGGCDNMRGGHRRRSSSRNSDSRVGALRRDFRGDPLGSLVRFVTWTSSSAAQPSRNSEPQISNTVELSMRRTSVASTASASSIFTISDSRTERRVGDPTEPAPRYEDLAPLPLPTPLPPPGDTSSMPPPPSYDDVLKGLYATTPAYGPSLLPPPPYTDVPLPVVSSAAPALSAQPASQNQSPSWDDSLSSTSSVLPAASNDVNPDISAPTSAPIAFEDFTTDDTLASTSQRPTSSASSSSSWSSPSVSEDASVSNVSRTRSRSVSLTRSRSGSRTRSRSMSPV